MYLHGSDKSSALSYLPFPSLPPVVAHSNPQRDPAPAREFTVPSAGVGPYTVPGSILERMDGWRSWIPSRDHVKEFQVSPSTRRAPVRQRIEGWR